MNPEAREVEVRVRVNIVRLVDIDTAKQEFTAKGFLEASWVEPQMRNSRLRRNVESEDGSGFYEVDLEKSVQRDGKLVLAAHSNIPSETYFTPRLELKNEVDTQNTFDWFEIYDNPQGEGPIVCFRRRFLSTFQFEINLRNFPVDAQILPINLVSFWSDKDSRKAPYYSVKLIKNLRGEYRSVVNINSFAKKSEYSLQNQVEFVEGRTRPEDSASKHRYPQLSIQMLVHRKVGFWGYNVVLPMFIISNSAFASLAIPVVEYSSRLGSNITILLTMVAFKFVVAGALPSINYLTLVDKYVLACFFMAFFIIVENFIVALLQLSDWAEPWVKFVVFGGVWNVGHVLAVLWILRLISVRDKKYAKFLIPEDCVWIGKLSEDTSEADIRTGMSLYGHVESIRIWTSQSAYEYVRAAQVNQQYPRPLPGSEQSKFAVVCFKSVTAAREAVEDFERKKEEDPSLIPDWFESKSSIEYLDPVWRMLGKPLKGGNETAGRFQVRVAVNKADGED